MWPFQKRTRADRDLLIATNCGHPTRLRGPISGTVDDTPFASELIMPKNDKGSTDYCLDCCAKMTIRCAWCGKLIMIGEPVTLYSPAHPFVIPPHTAVYSYDPMRLVGCGYSDCADTGADYAGFWIPGPDGNGMVDRHPTIIEHLLGAKVS